MIDFNGKVGDTVIVRDSYDGKEFIGSIGVVAKIDAACVQVLFDAPVATKTGGERGWRLGRKWGWNFFHTGDLEVVKAPKPTLARTLSLGPQDRTVLAHLEAGKDITPMKAMVVYGISRLAACINRIRNAGFAVNTEMLRDESGHKYATYKLVKA